MEEQLVKFETAKLAKESGFDYKTPQFYPTENPYSCHKDLKGVGVLGLLHSGTLYEKCDEIDEDSGLPTYKLNPGVVFAPNQHLLQKWLRECHDIHVNVNTRYNIAKLGTKPLYAVEISTKENGYGGLDDNLDQWLGLNKENQGNLFYHVFKTYEEALETGLVEGLNLIKKNGN